MNKLIAAILFLPLLASAQIVRDGVSVSTIDGVDLSGGSIDGISVASGGTDSPGTANLVAWWSMDETSGNAIDSHSGGYDLTDTGTVTDAAGLVGGSSGARDFDDINNEYFNGGDSTAFEFASGSMSIVCWVNLDEVTRNQVFVSKYSTSGDNREYMLRFELTDNKPRWFFSSDGTSGNTTSVTNTSASAMTAAGGWYFVYAYHDAVNDLLGVSTNDGTVDTVSHSTGGFAGTASFQVGAQDGSTTTEIDGQMDEVAIFNRVLTEAEVTWLYNAGSGRAYSDL